VKPAQPGGGKYDQVCEFALRATGARVALVAILEGNRGSGFSLSMVDPRLEAAIPALLRDIANQIEAAQLARSGGKRH
jgi:hypothetical protein